MDCQPLGEVADGRFGAGIGRNLGQGREGVHGGDIDDIAAALHHVLGEDLGGDQSAGEVQVEHELHALLIQIKEALGFGVNVAGLVILLVGGGSGVIAAGTVDEDGTPAQLLVDLLGGRFKRSRQCE